jgi:C1A family cysteine protease
MPHKIARYGWIPDLPDQRDHLFAAPPAVHAALPSAVDLTPNCPAVYDQGQLGSCTANGIAAAIEFDQMKQALADIFTPSRLFIYYNERVIEGTVGTDSGAQIRDGIKSISQKGACHEDLWPYDITQFTTQPPDAAYADALKHVAVAYQRVAQDLTQMKGCLADGYPFVFGFSVYHSFESQEVAQSGHAPMPAASEQLLGGHCVAAVGYDDANQWVKCRNSWGTGWGMQGYFTLPYAYLTQSNLSSDFWTIRVVG